MGEEVKKGREGRRWGKRKGDSERRGRGRGGGTNAC